MHKSAQNRKDDQRLNGPINHQAQGCVLRHGQSRPPSAVGLICTEHMAELRELLSDVGDLWAELPWSSLPAAMAGSSGEKHTKAPFTPALINLGALAVSDPRAIASGPVAVDRLHNGPRLETNGPEVPNVRAVLGGWCDVINAERSTAVDTSTVASMISALLRHLPWIVGQTSVLRFDHEIRACRRALAAAVGEDSGPPATRCPYCRTDCWTDWQRDVRALLRLGHGPSEAKGRVDRVVCTGCGRRWEGAFEVHRFVLMAEQEAARERERSA